MWTRWRHRVFDLMYFVLKSQISGITMELQSRGRLMSSKLHQLVLQLFSQSWFPLANYAVKAGVVCLQVKLCDPHLSALEVRFSRRGAIKIYVYLYLYLYNDIGLVLNMISKQKTMLTASHEWSQSLKIIIIIIVSGRPNNNNLQLAYFQYKLPLRLYRPTGGQK